MLIAGPNVYICDECVGICQDIVDRATDAHAEPPPIGRVSAPVFCSFCRMPTPEDDSLFIEHRGVLCVGCVSAIEAAIADRNSGDTSP